MKSANMTMGNHHQTNIWDTPWKFNIAPEKWWLEDYFPIGKVTFQGRAVKLREGTIFGTFSKHQTTGKSKKTHDHWSTSSHQNISAWHPWRPRPRCLPCFHCVMPCDPTCRRSSTKPKAAAVFYQNKTAGGRGTAASCANSSVKNLALANG